SMSSLNGAARSATKCCRGSATAMHGFTVQAEPHRQFSVPDSREPMARRPPSFVCQNCGAAYGRWQGKCDSCGEWNTVSRENAATAPPGPGRPPRKGRRFALEALAGESHDAPRLASGIAEFDRVTGGGFVRGSVLLVGGDPGIGKSTLLIQAAAALARAGERSVYISGEEAVAQVRLR